MLHATLGLLALSKSANACFHAFLTVPLVILAAAAPFNAWTPAETDLSESALLTAPPTALDQPVTLVLATFNIQDLMVVGRHRPERMRAIGAMLTEFDPDIVGIQESFIEPDRQVLLDALANSRLKYHHYFRSATVGSGLLTLSAYPITEAHFYRYQHDGKWYKPYHGDWWGGKGVSLARIQLPDDAGYIDFYDTHAHAGYLNRAEYLGVRKAQMHEMAAFLGASATQVSPAFLVGDMNCAPGGPDFQIALEEAQLVRLMAVGSGVDHIFGVRNPRYTFEVLDSQPIRKAVPIGPNRRVRLSDHTGYLSTIRITPTGT